MCPSNTLSVLRLIASPRGAESESLRLSHQVLDGIARQSGERPLSVTDLDLNTLAHVDGSYARVLAGSADMDPSQPASSLQRSDNLIHQLDKADVLVIATPMHNYGVPSALKAWIDHIVRIRVTFNSTPQGKVGLLRDRPVYGAISSGGLITGDRARQPDFLRPYLKAALATVGLNHPQFFTVEGTARGDVELAAARQKAEGHVIEFFSARPLGHANSGARSFSVVHQ